VNHNKSVIYVNYTPYENSGKVLDFLLDNFSLVFLFSIGHQNLGDKRRANKLVVYRNKKQVSEVLMYHLPVSPRLVFFMLPIRSFLNFIQILYRSILLRKQYGKVNVYFTVNAFTSFIGHVLRAFSVVDKTVFWVWDYYPIKHESKIVTIMRWAYWQFDKFAARADNLVFLNRRLMNVWKEHRVIPKSRDYPIVPIGTDVAQVKKHKNLNKIRVAFIGVLKKSQGLDMVFDCGADLKKAFPSLTLELIGSGQDEKYFIRKAIKSGLKANFYGYVDEKKFEDVLINSTIGIAPYIPSKSNVSFYGDPGKVKRYISFGLPAIITDVFEFSKELKNAGAGEIIEYGNASDLVAAISKIVKNYNKYQNNAIELNEKFYYKKIYPKMFKFS
jgi:glycosyltransferase involved in cell wall biosynthesis